MAYSVLDYEGSMVTLVIDMQMVLVILGTDHSVPTSYNIQSGKPLQCPQRVPLNSTEWCIYFGLGREPDANLHPVARTVACFYLWRVAFCILQFSSLPLFLQQVFIQSTRIYMKWPNWSHKWKPPEFQMCFPCISLDCWHEHCKAPGLSGFSVPVAKATQADGFASPFLSLASSCYVGQFVKQAPGAWGHCQNSLAGGAFWGKVSSYALEAQIMQDHFA